MNNEIKVNKPNKSITFINNGIAFSQFGVADEILDLIINLQQRCEYLERSNNRREDEIMSLRDECVDGETYKSRNEKAIEFVKKESRKCYTNQTSENPLKVIGNFMWHTDELLNILQGGDKE